MIHINQSVSNYENLDNDPLAHIPHGKKKHLISRNKEQYGPSGKLPNIEILVISNAACKIMMHKCHTLHLLYFTNHINLTHLRLLQGSNDERGAC